MGGGLSAEELQELMRDAGEGDGAAAAQAEPESPFYVHLRHLFGARVSDIGVLEEPPAPQSEQSPTSSPPGRFSIRAYSRLVRQ